MCIIYSHYPETLIAFSIKNQICTTKPKQKSMHAFVSSLVQCSPFVCLYFVIKLNIFPQKIFSIRKTSGQIM